MTSTGKGRASRHLTALSIGRKTIHTTCPASVISTTLFISKLFRGTDSPILCRTHAREELLEPWQGEPLELGGARQQARLAGKSAFIAPQLGSRQRRERPAVELAVQSVAQREPEWTRQIAVEGLTRLWWH